MIVPLHKRENKRAVWKQLSYGSDMRSPVHFTSDQATTRDVYKCAPGGPGTLTF